EEHVDYLINALFVKKLHGGQVELNKKYKDFFINLLDHFKIPHDNGFIAEEQEKKAIKRLKKIKLSHLEKYLRDKIDEDNKFEYLLIFRFFSTHWKLPAFQDLPEKNTLLKDIISK
ncbi:hypothetical protein ACFLR5_02240, partial [Elusimicrobiota bacterium]